MYKGPEAREKKPRTFWILKAKTRAEWMRLDADLLIGP